MTVTRQADAVLRSEGRGLSVERFEIRSDIGTSELLVRNREFLALSAQGTDVDLLIYRADYFPEGIEPPEE